MSSYTDTFEKTRENLQQFHSPLTMPGGYFFEHARTIKRIDLYYNSKFESGDYDSQGFKKYFYNITKPPCDIATKFIDLDTKDVVLTSETSDDEYRVWVMQRDLKQWMKEKNFGKLLNDIGFDYPKYGTVVLKNYKKGEWKKVNIHNLRMDTSVECLDKSSFVYEVLLMTKRDIQEMKVWDQEKVQELFDRNPEEFNFTVYECYDYNEEEGKPWKRSYKADFCHYSTKKGGAGVSLENEINNELAYLPGFVLYEDEVEKLPYRELHWEKVAGRWLGFGFAEYLFENQARRNELTNLKAKGMHFSSLHIFQTSDETIGRNLLTDMTNGQIIKTNSPVTPVVNEERNLSAFASEEAQWDRNTEQKTFSFDIARGDDLPSSTPLGVARLSAGMVQNYFKLKQENFGIFIKYVLLDDVIPSFQKENAKEHFLKFLSSDKEIERLRKAIINTQLKNSILDYALKNGFVPSSEAIQLEKARIEGVIKKRKDVILKIPEKFYENAKYLVDVVITGEQIDVGSRLQSLQSIFGIVGQNPMILQNPATKLIFTKMMELAGVSAVELDLLDTAPPQQMPQGMPPQGQQNPLAQIQAQLAQ